VRTHINKPTVILHNVKLFQEHKIIRSKWETDSIFTHQFCGRTAC